MFCIQQFHAGPGAVRKAWCVFRPNNVQVDLTWLLFYHVFMLHTLYATVECLLLLFDLFVSVRSQVSSYIVVLLLLLMMMSIFTRHVFSHSLTTVSWMQSRQPTLQLGLLAAVDNMWHCLAFATRAHVGCCKAPLLLTGCLGWSGSDYEFRSII